MRRILAAVMLGVIRIVLRGRGSIYIAECVLVGAATAVYY